MIGFETARAIAFAYREVEVAEKLLAEIDEDELESAEERVYMYGAM